MSTTEANIIQHPDTSYLTFDIRNSTPNELIDALEELKTKYPYKTVIRGGEEVTITHCLLSLEQDDYDDDRSVYIQEFREETTGEATQRLAAEEQRQAERDKWLKKQYAELHKKFGV